MVDPILEAKIVEAQAAATAATTSAAAIDLSPYIHEDGSNAMTGALAMGSNKITGLANATTSGDAVHKGQLDAYIHEDGSNAMTGALAMGSNKITGLANATTSGDAVHKGQLDAYIHEDGSNAMTGALSMGDNKITGLAAGDTDAATDSVNMGQLTSHTGDSSLHFTAGSIDHGALQGRGDDDHSIYVLADGTRTVTGGLEIGEPLGSSGGDPAASAAGVTVTSTAPQLTFSDRGDDNQTKKGFLCTPSYDKDEEKVAAIYLRNTISLSKLSVGGGDASVNAATAIGFYVASSVNTTTGTELCRLKSSGLRVGGSGNPDAAAILECTSTTQGLLVPRMTTVQKSAISSPPAGLVIFDTGTGKLECFDGSNWQAAW